MCKRDDTVVRLHWQGKFRGPDFAPITFQLRSVSHERLRDTKNRVITTVIAEPLSEMAEQELTKAARSDEDRLLQAIATDPTASIAALAKTLGWLTAKNEPHKSKVHRALGRLKDAKLLATERGQHMWKQSFEENGEKRKCVVRLNRSTPSGTVLLSVPPFHRFVERAERRRKPRCKKPRQSWFFAVPQDGTIALKESLKVSFRVPFRSTPFPMGPRGTPAAPNWRERL